MQSHLTSGLLLGRPLSPTSSPGLLLHQLRGMGGAEMGPPYRHIPENKQCILALVQEPSAEEEGENEGGATPTQACLSTSMPSMAALALCDPGQQRLLPLARRGLAHAEDTGLLLCSFSGCHGGQREGRCTQCCETREGPLQLSSSGAVQGPT